MTTADTGDRRNVHVLRLPGARPDSAYEGTVAGRYLIDSIIGQGGMGTVYEARDLILDRPVALKAFRPPPDDDAMGELRVLDEARCAARLVHPNVVVTFDLGIHDELPFLVMERLPGRTLDDELFDGPLALDRFARVADDVLRALDDAHDHEVLHRDLKPSNVLIAEDGRAKLSDFGLAQTFEQSEIVVDDGAALYGTPSYLAPELLGRAAPSPATDIYAAGMLLREALTGTRAHAGPTPEEIVRSIQQHRPAPLHEVAPHLPAALCEAIDDAIHPNPSQRPISAGALARRIREAIADAGSASSRSTPPPAAAPEPETPSSAGRSPSSEDLADVIDLWDDQPTQPVRTAAPALG